MPITDVMPSTRAGNPPTSRNLKGAFARQLAIRALSGLEDASEEMIAARHFPNSQLAIRLVDPVLRSAAAIADTTTPGWAAELVGQMVAEFAAGLRPLSAFGRLRDLGQAFELAGVPMGVPVREPNAGGTGAAWVGESGAIPVLQKRIGAGRLVPRKVAAVVPFSNELRSSSASQVERIMQAIVLQDLAQLIDSTLTDTRPASALRPAGLLHGVTGIPSVDVATDLAALGAAMTAAEAIAPVLLLHTSQLESLWSDPAFGPQLASGRLGPFAVLATYYMADPATVIALDAAAFASGLGVPDIATSQVAVLAMANADGTAPTQAIDASGALGTPGEVLPDGGIHVAGPPAGAGTANAVVMSMLQQYATALRVVEPVAWAMTRAGAVAAVTGAAW